MRRTPDIYGGADPRDLPAYTVRDAARIVGVANQTLRNWVYGRDFPSRTGRRTSAAVIHTPEPGLLSFTNLIEAHVLASLRRHRVTLSRKFVVPPLERLPEPFSLYVDECLGGVVVPDAIRRECLAGEIVLPTRRAEIDAAWLIEAGEKGWIASHEIASS